MPEVTTPDLSKLPKASTLEAMAMGKGKAHTHRLHTIALAKACGWKVTTKGEVTTYSKGDLSVTVTYSEQEYVRVATGSFTFIPGEAKKWVRLNKYLSTH